MITNSDNFRNNILIKPGLALNDSLKIAAAQPILIRQTQTLFAAHRRRGITAQQLGNEQTRGIGRAFANQTGLPGQALQDMRFHRLQIQIGGQQFAHLGGFSSDPALYQPVSQDFLLFEGL